MTHDIYQIILLSVCIGAVLVRIWDGCAEIYKLQNESQDRS